MARPAEPAPPGVYGRSTDGAAPPRRQARRPATALIVVVAVVVLAVVAVAGYLLSRDSSGLPYADLQVGNCFQMPAGSFSTVDTADCSEDHDVEVFAVVLHPAQVGEPFPGRDELERFAGSTCLAQFPGYAGVPFESLQLTDVYITPKEDTWNGGARELICGVTAADRQPTAGSIRAG